VEALGERLGEAVGEGGGEDGTVVVVVRLEASDQFVEPVAGGDGETADVIRAAGGLRGNEVGEGVVDGVPLALVHLLSEGVEGGEYILARVAGVDLDVVAGGVGREEAVDAVGGGGAPGGAGVEEGLGVSEEFAGALADGGIVEDGGVAALQFPGVEEGGPVDVGDQFGERVLLQDTDAGEGGDGEGAVVPVEPWRAATGLLQG